MAESAHGSAITGALLGLHALTSLHPGSGTALGTVDLPVQRERHTQWPTIPGSALKGVLRDACRERIARREDLDALERYDDEADRRAERTGTPRTRADATLLLNELFGPPTAGADRFGGAVSLADARILAFPVRSLKGLYAWATCPEILNRLKRDLSLIGMMAPWEDLPPLGENQAHSLSGSPCLDRTGKQIVLEEYDFERTGDGVRVAAHWIAEHLLPEGTSYSSTRQRFPAHCVMLRDEDFTHFTRFATEVTARIGLDYDTKTVKEGALFYQEYLPPETMFYAVILARPARVRTGAKSATELLERLSSALPAYLQIGGDETIGKGYCAAHICATSTRGA